MKKNLMTVLLMVITVFLSAVLFSGCEARSLNNLSDTESIKIQTEKSDSKACVKNINEKPEVLLCIIPDCDSEKNQELKKQIKNETVKYIYEKLSDVSCREETDKILKASRYEINDIACREIKKKDLNYNAETEILYDKIPDKSLEEVTGNEEKYEIVKVTLGKGSGKKLYCYLKIPESYDEAEGLDAIKNNENKTEYHFKIIESLKKIIDKNS